MASTSQEFAALQAAHETLTKERTQLLAGLSRWDRELSEKRRIVSALEQTLAELQCSGKVEGLPRCAAEVLTEGRNANVVSSPETAAAAAAEDVACAAAQAAAEAEAELHRRLALAVAKGASSSRSELGFQQLDFEREFGESSADDRLAAFLQSLSPEQRLVWELQNPPEFSPRVDGRLLHDLKKAGKSSEMELLTTAAGPPSESERQYRALLWLHHHKQLDACHAEPGVSDMSLLTLASRVGFCDVVRALLDRRAEVGQVGKSNISALSAACQHGSLSCVQALLQSAADPNQAPDGLSMLALAASLEGPHAQKAASLVQLLLESRANPEQLDGFGRSPLMAAAANGHAGCCEALLAARADLTLEDNEGKSAVRLAKAGGHAEVAACLQRALVIGGYPSSAKSAEA
eukprot:TRINITY_DN15598_c0_g1_i1.p1 TRINITY_DN15598_c0_g1~~TRINITY_DN15598_c0_g1_i1.p1  ORF type:complete len:406 (-),score=105.60 TRINITY_DN15598_c0_g1_i1:15-1232(-)